MIIKLAVTMGDPCGIGPEVVVKALARRLGRRGEGFVIVGDPEVMAAAVKRFGSAAIKRAWSRRANLSGEDPAAALGKNPVAFLAASRLLFSRLIPGRPGRREGEAVIESLEAAVKLTQSGVCQALVTAPVSKSALLDAGFPFPGHTDFLAARTGGKAVMMLAAGDFRVVPVTVHVPLAQAPGLLTRKLIRETIIVVHRELMTRFGIKNPRLAVSGLNPHAGEDGKLGREETVIRRAVADARTLGARVEGPFPADSLFAPGTRKAYDAFVCMFHDQALIPIKTLAFAKTVNLTLGLPLIRTSPAHGTAPEIAWQGKADPRSMASALDLAAELARRNRGAKGRVVASSK